MKYKDLIFNLNRLEKEHDQKFDTIELVNKDFYSIVNELNISKLESTRCLSSFKYNDVVFSEHVEHNMLKVGKATFCNSHRPIIDNIQPIVLFTTIDVLSEEEFCIKGILE